jgi:hypothetical protein
MIIKSTSDDEAVVIDADNLSELHVELGEGETLGALGQVEGTHAWLDIATLRSVGEQSASSPAWPDEFARMITYATDKGWVDQARGAVRAHIVPRC